MKTKRLSSDEHVESIPHAAIDVLPSIVMVMMYTRNAYVLPCIAFGCLFLAKVVSPCSLTSKPSSGCEE